MGETATFDRASLIAAFDRIGQGAVANHVRLEMAVYGGSALMLASNFRFATEDVDIAAIGEWPAWFSELTSTIARENGWSSDWLNEAVAVHLSPLASRAIDHIDFGIFPADSDGSGLAVFVPTAEYMLALKLKAMRILDPVKGRQEADDIYALMTVLGITSADAAIATLSRFFPTSGAASEKQRFLLKHLDPSDRARANDAPTYAR